MMSYDAMERMVWDAVRGELLPRRPAPTISVKGQDPPRHTENWKVTPVSPKGEQYHPLTQKFFTRPIMAN